MPLYEGHGSLTSDKSLFVVEIGAAYTKCGFSGEFAPRFIVKSEVRCRMTGRLRLLYDYKDRQDLYDLLVEFIHALYFRHALMNPKDKPIIVVESLLCPTLFRDTLASVLFNHYEVSAILVVPSHLVALAPLAIDTGLVVDVGYQEAVVIPIFCGVPVVHAWQALPLGSASVLNNIKTILAAENVGLGNVSEAVLEDICVRCCMVAPKARQIARQNDSSFGYCPAVTYPLGGAKLVNVSGKLRESAYEILYDEDNDHQSLATMLLDAICKVNIDMRVKLAENIVVIGGGSMAPGFTARLKAELLEQLKNTRYSKLKLEKFMFHNPPAKGNYVAWLGAAIYGCTDIVAMKALQRDQYFKENRLPDWIDIRDNRSA